MEWQLYRNFLVFYNYQHMRLLLEHLYRKAGKTLSFFLFLVIAIPAFAQPDPSLFSTLRWRMIGPHRGGRTVGGCGVPQQPNVFYIGVNNGGGWENTHFCPPRGPILHAPPTR